MSQQPQPYKVRSIHIVAKGTDWRFLNELKRELKG